MFVIDTSVVVKWYAPQDELYLTQADKLFEDINIGIVKGICPDLLVYELSNALLKGKRRKADTIQSDIESFISLPLQIILFRMNI
jgi:predicted nucleic acid-binding protein